MNFDLVLAAIKSAGDAVAGTITLLQTHQKTLDGIYAAVQEHQKQIDAQGPALPAGPIEKGR